MAWPTPQDYNEAIQNPRQNFEDQELAAGIPETSQLGLPRPITGNFASVYRLKCSGRDWAVRCFWREYADMQQRYSAISRHLAVAGLPYTVGFEYLPNGIKVHGHWYPVLKMEWVEGELLIPYIERNLHDSGALLSLARRWRTMVHDIERAGVAHGDLQHGNVLVVSGNLKLVDYDGMYVPALRGKGGHELGHQHYQHPDRSAADFAPWIDRFSGWVVYLSLLALSRHSELWEHLKAGDECLLLRKSDFLAPSSSPSLERLAGLGDSELRSLTDSLRAALGSGPANVPPLGMARTNRTNDSTVWSSLAVPLRLVWPRAGRVREGTRRRSSPEPVPGPASTPVMPPSWLVDHLAAESPNSHFHGPQVPARLLAGTSSAAVLTMAGGDAVHAIASTMLVAGLCVLIAVGNVGALLAWFHRDPEVRAMKKVLGRERQAGRNLASVERELRRLRRETASREQQTVNRSTRLLEAKERITERERRESEESNEVLEGSLQRTKERLNDLTRREKEEISFALADFQSGYVRRELGRESLRSAGLADVPTLLRWRLWTMGIRSAADVTQEGITSVRTLDESAMRSIVAWRVDAELRARRSIPHVLPTEQLERLTVGYGKERVRIEADQRQARDAERVRATTIKANRARGCAPLDERLIRLEEGQAVARRELQRRLAGSEERRALAAAHLARVQRDLEPYGELSFSRFVRATLLPP